MGEQDREVFLRETTAMSRSLSTRRPQRFLALAGIGLVLALVLGLVVGVAVDPAEGTLGGLLLAGLAVAVAAPGAWSRRHPELAVHTLDLREQSRARALRRSPGRWLGRAAATGSAAGVVLAVRDAEHVTAAVVLFGALGGGAITGSIVGAMTWRARRSRPSVPA